MVAFVFLAWFFVGRIFLADYYYQETRKTQDWPQILRYYEKVFSLNPQEPFYHQKLANDLKWGLQFYPQPEVKIQIVDLAITQMENIKAQERSFTTRLDLAQLYLLKASLTKTEQDFLKAEQAFQKVIQMSPQVARTYIYWCQLKIEQGKWDQAEEQCQKALSLYPSLSDARLISIHRQKIESEMSELYEKLGEIYLAQEKYSQAEQAFRQVLKFSFSPRPNIWKKIGDVYYSQGDLDTAIVKNLHGHILSPQDSFWCLTLALLYQEKGESEQALFWVEKGLTLDPDNKKLLFLLESLLGSDPKKRSSILPS